MSMAAINSAFRFLFVPSLFLLIAGCVERKFNTKSAPNVIGGYDRERDPHFVSLVTEGDEKPFCGATYVAEGVVLTAAHCVDWVDKPLDVVFAPAILSEVKSGARVRVSSIRIHPEYDILSQKNDIALLFIEKSNVSKVGPFAKPVGMSSPGKDPGVQEMVEVVGFGGVLSYGWTGTDTFRGVKVPVVANDTCQKLYGDIFETSLCAGDLQGGADSCQGDSGGPLYGKGSDGQPLLVGVVSWGWGCAQKLKPGVYTRVSAYADWIQGEIQREAALVKSPSPFGLHEMVTHGCYFGRAKSTEFVFSEEDKLTSSIDFSMPDRNARFQSSSKPSDSANSLWSCERYGMSVRAVGSLEQGFEFQAKAVDGTWHSSTAKGTYTLQGTCLTKYPGSVDLKPFNIRVTDDKDDGYAYFPGAEGYYWIAESLPPVANWSETTRCEKDGLLISFEESQGGEKFGRMKVKDPVKPGVTRTVVYKWEKFSRQSGSALNAFGKSLSSSRAVLDLTLGRETQVFGIELSCDQPFAILWKDSRIQPSEVSGKYVFKLWNEPKSSVGLPGPGRTRSLLLEWTNWKPKSAEDKLKCKLNGRDDFEVSFK